MLKTRFVGAALATCTVTIATSTAAAHDHESCAAALEHELVPVVREAAERAFVAWRSHIPRTHRTVKLQVLGINDFHGRITTGLKVADRPVGGAAVLAAYLRDEQARFDGPSLIVHAGDHVGASPPESALLQDEPAIQFLNLLANDKCGWFAAHPLCNVIGTLGNHEFDEGVDEMLRLIQGGNSPKGPFLEEPWGGARFAYVSSNVHETGEPYETLLPPYVVKIVNGERVGFIGAVLKGTPSIVTAEGVAGVTFEDEADAINRSVARLERMGIRAIVVQIHQGGSQKSYQGATSAEAGAPSGDILDIISRLDSAVDVVVSGHTHQFTNALVKNAAGHPILVTQAFSSGTAYGDIELTIDRVTHDVVEKSARIVTTYGDAGPGLVPAADVASLVESAKAKVAPLVNRVVGQAAVALTRAQSPAGESALGNLIADAQRAAMGADIAFLNPGGIRADLDVGEITWGELFTVQPFANSLVQMKLTGAQVLLALEQQWSNAASPRFLQVSGLTYHWDGNRPVGSRVVAAQHEGLPIDPMQVYSVVVNSFIAGGGDGFAVFTQGVDRSVGPVDLDALVHYVEQLGAPVNATIEGRILTP